MDCYKIWGPKKMGALCGSARPLGTSLVLLGLTNYMALSSIVTQQAKYYWILVL